MRCHISQWARRGARAIFSSLFVFALLSIAANDCRAANENDAPPRLPPRPEIRSGGVIEESYVYHRQQSARVTGAARSIEPASGWYGYGFPVSTFRWGWFGAAHYYPTVF